MEYSLHPRDYAKAFKFHYGIRSPLSQCFMILIWVGFIWVVVSDLIDSFNFLLIALGLPCAIIFGHFAFGGYFWSRRARKQLRQMGKERVDVKLEFDNDHIRINDAESSTDFVWDKIVKWYAQDNLVLLYRHKSFFHLVDLDQLPHDRSMQLLAILEERVKGSSKKISARYRPIRAEA